MLKKLIDQAQFGRLGENWVKVGDTAAAELVRLQKIEKAAREYEKSLVHLKKWCGQDQSALTAPALAAAIIRMIDDATASASDERGTK